MQILSPFYANYLDIELVGKKLKCVFYFYQCRPPRETMEFDIEEALYQIEDYDDMTQLQMLNQEIQHIMDHGIQPPQEWFEMRFQKVYQYSEIDWIRIVRQFQGKDTSYEATYIVETCHNIVLMIQSIIDEWGVSPIFTLSTYYQLLYDMEHVVTLYRTLYIGSETDDDIADLIVGISQL